MLVVILHYTAYRCNIFDYCTNIFISIRERWNIMDYLKNHKLLVITSFILALIIVKSGILQSLLLFILVGAIPGSELSVPPVFMAIGVMTITLFVSLTFALKIKSVIETRVSKPKAHQLPRRRYVD